MRSRYHPVGGLQQSIAISGLQRLITFITESLRKFTTYGLKACISVSSLIECPLWLKMFSQDFALRGTATQSLRAPGDG